MSERHRSTADCRVGGARSRQLRGRKNEIKVAKAYLALKAAKSAGICPGGKLR